MALFESLLLDPAPFEVWIAKRTDGVLGSGKLNDPWDGSTTTRLDSILSQLPATPPTTVHLGPGTFTTKGYTDEPSVTPGWEIKAGFKIVGAGIGVTTLQLAATNAGPAAQLFAVGHRLLIGTNFNPMDLCEVSDLTIDANLGAHDSNVAAGAVRLMGNHVRVRRVKVINWGTKTTSKLCSVVQLITAHTDATAGRIELENAGIEECIAITPSGASVGKTTVFHAGRKEEAAIPLGDQMEGYGLAPVIRNCFVDAAGVDLTTSEIRALSMGSCRAGTVEGNQIHNVQIGGPYQELATTREIVVRGNTYKNVIRGPWWKLGGLGASIGISVIDIVGAPSKSALATTNSNHSLQVGERVRISGAVEAPANGVFVVAEVPAANKLQYVMESSLSAVSGTITLEKVYGASNILIEQNVIELATTGTVPAIQVDDGPVGAALGGNQGADFVHTEAILRNNTIRYLNGQLEASYAGYGIELAGVKDVIVRDQILELTPGDPIKNLRCRNVTYFNNKKHSGILVQGYNALSNTKYGELETATEDTLILTLG